MLPSEADGKLACNATKIPDAARPGFFLDGCNQSGLSPTKITSDADLQMGELKLPKGSYSIWTIPNEKEWTLIINKETGQFHLYYKQQLDFGRTPMKVKTIDTPVEAFRVDLRDDGGNKGTLALVWENTEAYIPFTVLR